MKNKSLPWFKGFIKRITHTSLNPLEFFELLVKNDDIIRLPVFKPTFLINDPEAIHHIMLANRDNYTKVGTSYERIENVVGKGLLTTSGEEWRLRRDKFQELFQGKHLHKYIPTIKSYTEKLLQTWEKKEGGIVNISEEMLALVMNISSEAFLGFDISSRSLEMVRMIHILNVYAVRSLTLWKWLPTLRNLRYQVAKKTVDNYILNSLTSNHKSTEPLLGCLLARDAQGNLLLSTDEVLGEIKNFFVAGHETTGNVLSFAFYCLAKNSYVLTQVLHELKSISEQDLENFEVLDSLPYLNKVISETMRLYPPIWIFTRKALGEDIIQNYKIPAGSIINILPYLIHRHPKYWNQPEIFYPERFLPEYNSTRPKCAYIPFGVGQRVCIGRQFAMMNIKIIMSMILRKFVISLPRKNYVVEPLPLITLKPKKDVKLHIELIKNA